MMTYPPTRIDSPDNCINILQLTDLHLYHDTYQQVFDQNPHDNFIACLSQALQQAKNKSMRCDLIVITGDLVNEVHHQIYDRIVAILDNTKIPYALLAGNHDVTDEVSTHLPYNQRRYIAHRPDNRLLSRHVIQVNNWKLLFIDSSVPGKVYGHVGKENINWLQQELSLNLPKTKQQAIESVANNPVNRNNSNQFVIIIMHHHILPISTTWINKHITDDASDLWELIETSEQIKAVLHGHIHQQYKQQHKGVTIYSSPSTSYQFMPNKDVFTLDESAQPGYRWLQLKANGEIKSWIERLDKP